MCAVGFDLFSRLDGSPATAEEVATELHLDDDAAFDFLNLLTAMGLLERSGEGRRAHFRTGAMAARHLSARDDGCLAGLLKVWNSRSYRMWANLETALRTGRQSSSAMGEDVSRQGLERFLATFDLSVHLRLCALGGQASVVAISAARMAPHLECITLEDPEAVPISRRQVAEAGLMDRVGVMIGNPATHPLPPADVYMLTTVLRRQDMAHRRLLLQRIFDVLPPQGVLVAIESWADAERCPNVPRMLSSLSFLLELGDPSEPTLAEFVAWCGEIGFRAFERLQLAGTCAAAIAYKSARAGSSASVSIDEKLVPVVRIERTTYRLQGGCSTD